MNTSTMSEAQLAALEAEYDVLFGDAGQEGLATAPEGGEEARPPWQIHDEGEAEWAASKIKLAYLRLEAAKRRRAKYLERLDAEVERAQKVYQSAEDWLGGKLHDWIKVQLAGVKTRSMRFLCGVRGGFRRLQARAEVYDENLAISHLEQTHPELLRIKKEVKAKALTEYALANPEEQLPGVQRLDARDNFYVTVEELEVL